MNILTLFSKVKNNVKILTLFVLSALVTCIYFFQKGKISQKNAINKKILRNITKIKKANSKLTITKRNKLRKQYNR